MKPLKIITIVLVTCLFVGCVYIMSKGIGLSNDLDFGAGAYYYADIPNFEKFVNKDIFSTGIPMWVHIALFFIWGFLMYKLWCWIDSKK